MPEEPKDDGTHVIEPDVASADVTVLVTRTINTHEVEVSPELAKILDEQQAHYGSLQTKHQDAMATAKATQTHSAELLQKDIEWYGKNPQEAWASYVPLVQDENGGFKGDPSLLVPKAPTDDTYGDTESPKPSAMTPDPMLSEVSKLRKETEDLRMERERDRATDVKDTVARLLPKFTLAKHSEVLSAVAQHYNSTGKHADRATVERFLKESHDSTMAVAQKAGTFTATPQPRYEGSAPGGALPREAVKGIKGNVFGNQAERDAANQALADLID